MKRSDRLTRTAVTAATMLGAFLLMTGIAYAMCGIFGHTYSGSYHDRDCPYYGSGMSSPASSSGGYYVPHRPSAAVLAQRKAATEEAERARRHAEVKKRIKREKERKARRFREMPIVPVDKAVGVDLSSQQAYVARQAGTSFFGKSGAAGFQGKMATGTSNPTKLSSESLDRVISMLKAATGPKTSAEDAKFLMQETGAEMEHAILRVKVGSGRSGAVSATEREEFRAAVGKLKQDHTALERTAGKLRQLEETVSRLIDKIKSTSGDELLANVAKLKEAQGRLQDTRQTYARQEKTVVITQREIDSALGN